MLNIEQAIMAKPRNKIYGGDVFMECGLTELRCKEVINLCDGCCIGCVDDLLIDTCEQKVIALVVFGRPRWFGLFGREDDIIINWDKIEKIGCDTILVKTDQCAEKPCRNWFSAFFK